MTRQLFIKWLRETIPPSRWEQLWLLAPVTMLFLPPIGSGLLPIVGILGWDDAPRASQGLMIFCVLSGPIVGAVILWCVDESGLNPQLISRTKWLARLSVVVPLLTLLVMFFIARIP